MRLLSVTVDDLSLAVLHIWHNRTPQGGDDYPWYDPSNGIGIFCRRRSGKLRRIRSHYTQRQCPMVRGCITSCICELGRDMLFQNQVALMKVKFLNLSRSLWQCAYVCSPHNGQTHDANCQGPGGNGSRVSEPSFMQVVLCIWPILSMQLIILAPFLFRSMVRVNAPWE